MSISRYYRHLPSGWYPVTENDLLSTISAWEKADETQKASSVVVPHAGWYFSGRLAYKVLSGVSNDPEIVVVAGGHLSSWERPLIYHYSEYVCPQGMLYASAELTNHIESSVECAAEQSYDNSIEVQLPLIKHFFPECKIVCIRVPPNESAIMAAESVFTFAMEQNKEILVVGSTDLTHYGPNYMFAKDLNGIDAVIWVKEKNDKLFIDACTSYDIQRIMDLSIREKSACSAGAAAMAVRYAQLSHADTPYLIGHYTSYDVQESDSFVGYAGLLFS